MAEASFEVWINRRRRGRPFRSDVSPNDEAGCVALLRTEAKRHRVKVSAVELKVRHRGRTTVYRAS